jgi:hypothetical protein
LITRAPRQPQICRLRFAATPVGFDFECDAIADAQGPDASALDGGDVEENVCAGIVAPQEGEASIPPSRFY